MPETNADTDAPEDWPSAGPAPSELRQPKGIWCLFVVEMWERFSYYGMRAILVLYLTAEALRTQDAGTAPNPGRGWDVQPATTLYGWYTGLAYLFPIIGGLIADKLIGTHRSMIIGASLIALGHIMLAVSGFGELAHNDMGMSIFITGLALIILGTGHFKPSSAVMVGQLYPKGDPRRDGGFTIYYMGVNVGAFICPFICGTLGEKVGWHWGFGSAAVGMVLGLMAYLMGRPVFLRGIGMPPEGGGRSAPLFFVGSVIVATLFGAFYYLGGVDAIGALFAKLTDVVPANILLVGGLLLVLALCLRFIAMQAPGDKGPVTTVLCFIFFNAFFWMAFEQAGSSLNIFARDNTDRVLFDWEMPTSWFQSINPLLIVALGPLYSIMWSRLGRRGLNPTQSLKIACGLLLLGGGYCFMIAAGAMSADGARVGVFWLSVTYLLHTMGELCLSPTGLSFVTKASPVKWVSFLMGIWFLSNFVANLGGGLVAGYVKKIEAGEIELFWYEWFRFGGQGDFYFLFVFSSVGAALLILILTPLFKKLLHGRG